jgi:hypothetical protein
MMSFFQSIRSGLNALLHVSAIPRSSRSLSSVEGPTVTVEDIRTLMLEMVGEPTEDSAILVRRIRYAADPQALWFLRSELMGLLARRQGESIARAKLEVVSEMFHELLPSGLRSRPSPLLSAREDRRHSRPHT